LVLLALQPFLCFWVQIAKNHLCEGSYFLTVSIKLWEESQISVQASFYFQGLKRRDSIPNQVRPAKLIVSFSSIPECVVVPKELNQLSPSPIL
jgi:hypothetical protein